MADAAAPVGVFDSGIGGLTVVREIRRQLPNEDVIYFGDTARVPYGPKSPETVRRYAHEIATFLIGEGVKAIVVACNTATAHALEALRASFTLPIVGVIEPGARAAARVRKSGTVGVIGTLGTIRSGAYERAIHDVDASIPVIARACPLFVPFVEEGWLDHPATRLVAEEYLTPFRADEIDTLVLGCTHYPLITSVIGRTLGRDVRLIDSAAETAAELGRVLDAASLAAPVRSSADLRVIASDTPDQLVNVGGRFLGLPIERVETMTL